MNKEEYIKQLRRQQLRENTLFYRRRIDRGDGKKTVGWIMKEKNKPIKENINITILKEGIGQ